MIGPADIEAWTEDAKASETTAERETAARSTTRPTQFSLVAPMAASLSLPWRLALERRLARRRSG
ncbi:MAG: hypothetical protein LWW93_07965 [Hyphomicrobiales bacterium]|nr:hypothetical protein [Hyphomicrobiales bacterium]